MSCENAQMGPGFFLYFKNPCPKPKDKEGGWHGLGDYMEEEFLHILEEEDEIILKVIKTFLGKRHELN